MGIKVANTTVFDDAASLSGITTIPDALAAKWLEAPSGFSFPASFERGDLTRSFDYHLSQGSVLGTVGQCAFLTGGEFQLQFQMTSSSSISLDRLRGDSWTSIATWNSAGARTLDVEVRPGDHLRFRRTGGSAVSMAYCRVVVDANSQPMYVNLTNE